ncbi:MAG: hypothetical protein HON68_05520 [Gammaproteobacteria bacterium]|jgi:hypothetical protein|nr:hypothetical protein [Gammaproteobacteria bacterium]MBT3488342.1 hypothetical protein [Gammaproteobacteria bacterium]MBT3718354.1 hypothetical protein [Gammaproteobacteria bacterium]MBT3845624.1 hypothetical protein [Gammaproteobacteria bacterium]MBT3893201.1 hypothetical protein [Gammaproteobacteria bacterium]
MNKNQLLEKVYEQARYPRIAILQDFIALFGNIPLSHLEKVGVERLAAQVRMNHMQGNALDSGVIEMQP